MVNYNHMMPTRYSVDISFDKANINKELLKVTHDKEMDSYCPESRTRARATSQQGSHGCCWVRVARASRDSEDDVLTTSPSAPAAAHTGSSMIQGREARRRGWGTNII